MIFLNVILPVFLIIATGFFLQKTKNPDFKSVSDLTLYFLTPCLIFSGLLNSKQDISEFIYPGIAFMILLTISMWILSLITGKLLKFDSKEQSAFSLSTIMMNTGNFGVPLILFAFGEKGLPYAIIILILFTFPLGTLAVFIASKGEKNIKDSLIEIIRVPLFYSILLAVFFKFFNISLPKLIMKPITMMGDAAIPCLLLLLGMQLANTNLKLNFKPIGANLVVRLIISPIIAFLLCKLLGITGMPSKILIIQTSTPSAIIPLLYAINYNTRPDIVAGCIFFSTLFSALTLTILMTILGL